MRNCANINHCDKHGNSLVFLACQQRFSKVVNLLLKNNANANLCNDEGHTPLSTACRHGHLDM